MNKGILLSCVLALATLGGGYWLGKHHAAAPMPNAAADASLPETPALPPVKNSPVNNPPAPTVGKLSLAEIEAKIHALNGSLGRSGFGYRELTKLMDSADVA